MLAKNYFYERKTNQFADKPKDRRIDAQSAGQAYLAYSLDMPEVAKKDRGRVFGDLFDTVFSDDLLPEHLIMPLKILNKINGVKKEVQKKVRNELPVDAKDLFIIDGSYHVLFAVRRMCVRDGVDEFSEDALDKVDAAILSVKNCVEANRDERFSYNRFFKDAGTRTKIDSTISNP